MISLGPKKSPRQGSPSIGQALSCSACGGGQTSSNYLNQNYLLQRIRNVTRFIKPVSQDSRCLGHAVSSHKTEAQRYHPSAPQTRGLASRPACLPGICGCLSREEPPLCWGPGPRPEGTRTAPGSQWLAYRWACRLATALPGDAGGDGTDTPCLLDPSLSGRQFGAPQPFCHHEGRGWSCWQPPLKIKSEANAAEEHKGRRRLDPAVSEAHFSCVHHSNSLLLFSVP